MPPQPVAAAVLGLAVFVSLAFHEPIVARIAAIDPDPELLDADDLE